MKNSIWVAKNSQGIVIASFVKPILSEDGLFTSCGSTKYYTHCECNVFGLVLEKGEIVEVIYDTKTNEVEVKREREVGWYLIVNDKEPDAFAAFYNGEYWMLIPNPAKWKFGISCVPIEDRNLTVVSSIIKDNEYLRGLE